MKKKYSVTIFALTTIWAYYKDNSIRLVRRWVRVAKGSFAKKKEALSFASQHTTYYTKATLRKEVK